MLNVRFTADMFTTLVPLSVHNAIEIYEGKRKELVAQQIARLRESNNLLNGYDCESLLKLFCTLR